MAPTTPVTGALADNATSVQIPASSAYVAGDRRYVVITLSTGPAGSAPTGWTKTLDVQVGLSSTRRMVVFERDAVGADGAVAFSWPSASNFSATYFCTRGGLATIIGPSYDSLDAGTPPIVAPGQTTTLDDSLFIALFVSLNSSSSVANITPAGMTSLASVVPSGGAGHVARLASEIRPTAGATGTRSSTPQVTARWASLSFAVSPSGLADPIWTGDFETGDFAQFVDPTGGVDQLSPQTRAIVTSPVRAGSYAAEFAVNGVATSVTPNTERSEGRAQSLGFAEGDDRWIAGSIRLPSGFPTNPGAFQVVMQLKADVNGTPPVTLNVEGGQLQLQGGFGRPAGSLPMPAKTLVSSIATDVWYDVLLHVKFSSDPAVGEVTVWVNGTQVLAPYKPPGGTMYATYPSYFKIGLYRDPGLAYGPTTKVFHDEWRVGTTRAAVELAGTTVLAAASLGGALTLGATAQQDHRAAATLGGSLSLTAAARQDHVAAASLGGSLSLSAAPVVAKPASATLGGALTVSATAGRDQPVAATLGGSLSVSATVGPAASATLGGTLTVTAEATQDHHAEATLGGALGVAAFAASDQGVSATLGGSLTVSAQAQGDLPVSATLGGSLTVGAAATRVHPAAAAAGGALGVQAAATRTTFAQASLGGTLTVSATATGTAAGTLNVSVWAVDPDGGGLIPLPNWTKVSFAQIRNTPGAISLEYAADEAGFDVLRSNITDDRDIEIEIWLGGKRSTALRGILYDSSGDDVDEHGTWTFTGAFLECLLEEVVVWSQPADPKKELRFSAATAGAVVGTLLSQAQSRGALAGMTKDFTNTLDSSGMPWPEFVTMKFSPGTEYLAALQKLVELGLLEFEVTAARVLRCYRPSGMGADRSTGPNPTIIRRGRNVTEAPRKHSVRDSVTALLTSGGEGVYATATDATAQARRGRRIEGTTSSNSLTDLGAVQAYGGKTLATRTSGQMTLLLGLTFGVGHPRPMTHFKVNDWVLADSTNTLERLRVAQFTVLVDRSGPDGSVTLNDLATDWQIRAERRLNALRNGDVVIGTSTQSPGSDTVAPSPPTSITLGSFAYQVGGTDTAVVQVGWTAPTSNVDGTALFDLAGFRARLEVPGSAPGVFTTSPDVGAAASSLQFSGVQTGVGVRVQVQAFDRDGNNSAWSAPADHQTESDTTAPVAPSAPDVSSYLGQLRIHWDGLGAGGVPMPLDLDRVEVHLSTANNFAPSATTLIDQFAVSPGDRMATDLPYGVTHYVRLVAVDYTGNRSTPSAVGSAVPGKVVSDDVFAGAIGTAQLAELAVTTAKVNLLAVNDAQVGNLSVGKLTAGTLSALVTLSGLFRTAASGKRMEIDGNGWRAYKTDGTTKFAELNIANETITVVGTYRSGLTGERIEAPADGTLRWYAASGPDYAEIANNGADLRFRSRADGSGRRSFIEFTPAGMQISWGPESGTRLSGADFGVTYGVVRAPVVGQRILTQFAPADGTEKRSFVVFSSSSGDLGPSVWHFLRASSGRGILIGASADAGLKPEGGVVEIVKGSGMVFAPCRAENFLQGSALATKTDVRPIRAGIGLRAVDVTRMAPAVEWMRSLQALPPRPAKPGHKLRRIADDGSEYWVDAEWDWDELPRPKHYGPIADDLLKVAPTLVQRMHDGGLVVDIGSLAGVAWAAAADNADDVDALRREVAELWALLAPQPPVVDGEVVSG